MSSGTHQVVVVRETGGIDSLQLETQVIPLPGPGEAQIRHRAIGLNFIDTYFRTGLYKAPSLPFTPGAEGAGVVTAVGEGVDDLQVGDRVAYAGASLGAYSEYRLIPADRLVPLPDDISDEVAAAALLKGLTAEYLLRRTFQVRGGETILVHAGAGGVGSLLCQWGKHLGATVIATVGSEAKARLARQYGASEVILYRKESVSARVRELTGGAGVPVVYDSVGADTFMDSLDCLAPRGLMVSFGQASGKVPALDIALLSQKGSLFLTRPTLGTYTHDRTELLQASEALFSVLRAGVLSVHIGQRYPLADIRLAHMDLESRKTVGSSVLIP
ncbi:MAG: quinone oxidoreductase [Polyangiaceae bacterium]|nr:quinone oxidoreductase [Polyangiaceae bacterium]